MSSRQARRARLIGTWALLATLVTISVMANRAGVPAVPADDGLASASAGARWLLPAPMEKLGAIEVVHEGALYRFERDASGAWFHHRAHSALEATHEHRPDALAAKEIDRVLTGFGRTRIERSFPLSSAAASVGPTDASQPGEPQGQRYGVAVPSLIVLVYAPGSLQPWVQYAVGDLAPDGHSRYVLPIGSSSVVTIANYQVKNVLSLIAEAQRAKG